MPRSTQMVSLYLAAAVVAVVLAIYYAVSHSARSLLIAGSQGHHTKHAILFAAIAVVALIGASMSRPRAIDA